MKKKTHEEFIAQVAVKHPNITVLDVYINSQTKIKFRCNIDKNIWEALPYSLTKTDSSGCPLCTERKKEKIEIRNNIAMTHPHLVKYFEDPGLAKTLSCDSIKKVKFKCPTCGWNKEDTPNKISTDGFFCKKCYSLNKENAIIGIYRITNIITGESYIGQSKDIITRWEQHDQHLLNNTHHSKKFQEAFNMYGANYFIKTILKIYPQYDKKLLDKDERMYIQIYNSYYRGYNMRPTG